MRLLLAACLLAVFTLPGDRADAYPTDAAAQEHTGFPRLKFQQDIDTRKRKGYTRTPLGARWPMDKIQLRMLGNRNFDITTESPKDPDLQAGLEAILKKWRWRRYNVAILDITDPKKPRYAAVHESEQQTPGSVAKVLLGAGLLNELKKRFPKDVGKRRKLLMETMVPADDWAMPNHHEVPVIIGDPWKEPDKYRWQIRSVRRGDTFSVWQWMDNALSPSSNASASMTWREATLLRQLGEAYPPEKYDAELFKKWTREELTEAAFSVVDAPLTDAGLNPEDFHIRLFFTRGAGKYIKGDTSRASPLGVLRWMLRVEQGRMVDQWSSMELKRMLYLTRRRIRYAKAPELDDSAVIFKTGSLYKCQAEEGFTCIQYQGNVVNVLNAIVEVETPPPHLTKAAIEGRDKAAKEAQAAHDKAVKAAAKEGKPAPEPPAPPPEPKEDPSFVPRVYMVAVMSNELKRNAATDHSRLGSEIHKLIVGEPEKAE